MNIGPRWTSSSRVSDSHSRKTHAHTFIKHSDIVIEGIKSNSLDLEFLLTGFWPLLLASLCLVMPYEEQILQNLVL